VRNIIPFTIIMLILLSITVILGDKITSNTSYARQNNVNTSTSSSSSFFSNMSTSGNSKKDTTPPYVNITYPPYPPTINTGNITIKGTANDSSGIKNITVDTHTFPFNGSFPISAAATPSLISKGNASSWSVPFMFNKTDVYRVVISVTDNSNNTSYPETTINVVLPNKTSSPPPSSNTTTTTTKVEQKIPKIAFVRPTFTESAYQEHGFYRFYFKYGFPPFGTNITTDNDMFTVKTPGSIAELKDESELKNLTNITSLVPINGTELDDISFDGFPDPQPFWIPFIDNVKKDVPNAFTTVMRDEDVNDGHIFTDDNNPNTNTTNRTNAYDILLLFHNEYVTQKEYDNLRQFVKNGGTIVFIDGNVFFAQVKYDKDNHKITLVQGHDWKFDGKVVTRGPSERWYNETKQWVGGNYLINFIANKVTFSNNPFNYTHFEEQFVNNPKDKIIIDYGIKFPPGDYLKNPSLKEKKVATYTLDYGKGQVIMLGIFGQNLADNEKFMKFFDSVIIPKSICPKFQSCNTLYDK
jgi:hypothetical protein